MFRPQAIAVLPPMASQYDSAREDIQDVLSGALTKTASIERVVTPENVTDIFQGSKEAFDSLVFYFSRLEMTGQSDKESAIKLGKALNVDSFLVVRVNSWEYMRKEGDNVGRVGLSLRLVDATTGTTVWKARHEKSSSYMFYRPNLEGCRQRSRQRDDRVHASPVPKPLFVVTRARKQVDQSRTVDRALRRRTRNIAVLSRHARLSDDEFRHACTIRSDDAAICLTMALPTMTPSA